VLNAFLWEVFFVALPEEFFYRGYLKGRRNASFSGRGRLEGVLSRLFLLPGAAYTEPLLSWKFEVAPAGLGFVSGQGLGQEYEGDLIVGAARTFLLGGQLWRFKLNGERQAFVFGDLRLDDRVADNLDKHDLTESESLLFGQDFGIATDIQPGPHGTLYVVSLSNGAIYEIHRR
jgi:glucose/arabinose dehydrogenase